MKIGSLFSGYGGLDRGVQAVLGGETAWVSDIDKGACRILAHRYPDVPNLGDISTIDWSSVEPVDVLTGGFPCQDVSHAGKRLGMRPDTRSGLWTQMAYAIDQLRPSLVIAENVRGLLSAEAHSDLEPCPWCLGDERGSVLRALGAVLGDLADLGYDASWYGLRAADVGAPHGRFRIFVVAYPASDTRRLEQRDGAAPAADTRGQHGEQWRIAAPGQATSGRSLGEPAGRGGALLPTPRGTDHHDSLNAPGSRRHVEAGNGTLAETIGYQLLPTPRAGDGEKGGPNQRGSSGDLMLPSAVTHLLPTPAVNDMGDRPWANPQTWDAWVAKHKARGINGNGHGASLAIEAQRLLPTPSARLGDGTSRGASHPDRRKELCSKRAGELDEVAVHLLTDPDRWGIYADAIARWESLTRPAPAPTQPSKKGTPQLSPAFSEWMMGLPAGWVTDVPVLTRNEQLKALGNGVVPQQCEAALRFLLTTMAVAA